jgi:Transglutaminase-like superfamily
VIERVRRLVSLGPSEIAMLCGALLILARTRLALSILPWRRMRAPVIRSIAPALRTNADRLEWAIRATSRFIPRATCLTQALALQRLLAHHGYESRVQIGARNTDGHFGAHAWVEHEGGSFLSTAAELTRYARFFSWPPSEPDLP